MNNREVMQQALSDICAARLCEINSMSSRGEMERLMDKAATALRAALIKPEPRNQCGETCERSKLCAVCAKRLAEPQEPGAPFLCRMGEQEFLLHYIDGRYSFCTDEKGFVHHPVPQRQPLPKHDQHCVDVPGYGLMATKLVRAVERAHGIGGQDGQG